MKIASLLKLTYMSQRYNDEKKVPIVLCRLLKNVTDVSVKFLWLYYKNIISTEFFSLSLSLSPSLSLYLSIYPSLSLSLFLSLCPRLPYIIPNIILAQVFSIQFMDL